MRRADPDRNKPGAQAPSFDETRGDQVLKGALTIYFRLNHYWRPSRWRGVDEIVPGVVKFQKPFLDALGKPVALLRCYKRDELKAAIALPETDDGRETYHSGLLVYNGIMFAPADGKQSPAQVISEEFRVTSFIVQSLVAQYDSIGLATHSAFSDLRPFLWFRYGEPGPHFAFALRYTTIISLDGEAGMSLDSAPLYDRLNKSRRQEIRYGRRAKVTTEETDDIDQFIDLYELTFKRQELTVPPGEAAQIRRSLENLAAYGKLRLFASTTAKGLLGSMAAFAVDSKRAYYAFGANHPDARDTHTGTMALWDGFQALRDADIQEVDLEGINSPKRGYFKLSFGGSLVPYYILTLPTDVV